MVRDTQLLTIEAETKACSGQQKNLPANGLPHLLAHEALAQWIFLREQITSS